MIGIYRIVNKLNGKCYVGQSKNLEERIKSHLVSSSSDLLHADMELLGYTNFYGEILQECSVDELNSLETYYISKFKSTDPDYGYNILPGGGRDPNYSVSEDTKEKLSKTRKKLYENPEFKHSTEGSRLIYKDNIQARASGKRLQDLLNDGWSLGTTQEYKDNLSRVNTGENNPAYGKGYKFAGENNHFFGKHHSEESKQKIRDHMPDTTFNWRGHHHSEESKQKMRGPRPSIMGEKNHSYGKRGEDSYLWGYRSINKDGVTKRVKPEVLQQYLDDGWTLGDARSKDESSNRYVTTLGRKAMNKDGVVKMIPKEEIEQYLSLGWILGTKKSK